MKIGSYLLALASGLFLLAGLLPNASKAQTPLPPEVHRALLVIRSQDIIEHAKILSSPGFEGRKAGTPAGRRSAIHIANDFRQIGLLPGGRAGSFYSPFKIQLGYKIKSEMQITIGDKTLGELKWGEDYIPLNLPGGKADIAAACLLIGYGISLPRHGFDEYGQVDIRDKAVIIFTSAPWHNFRQQWPEDTSNLEKSAALAAKIKNAEKHGAACVLLAANPAGWRKQLGVKEQLKVPDLNFPVNSAVPVLQITRDLLARMTMLSLPELRMLASDIARDRTPQSLALPGRRLRLRALVSGKAWIGRNIIGVLPGRDEKLRKEAVIIGAHYDHLGELDNDTIFFGANDNAAGVGALIAVAEAFAALPMRPRRTVIFIAFDAEEIGRIGSTSYVKRPVIPVAQTVLMINFDMIGRNDADHIYAVGTTSSPELHQIHQQVNQHVGLRLTHPQSYRLGLSDHSAFYYAGIPIMYLFGGLEPNYHSPRDTWDKLVPAKVEKVARLAFLTAWQVAELPQRLTFNKKY